jgi:hypothetical protein
MEKVEIFRKLFTEQELDRAEFQPLWIRIECLNALGDHKEALEVLLNDPHHTRLGLAELYEKVGKYDTARETYAELATEYARYFYTQLPETLMIKFHEYFMKYNFRRITYRILNLEEYMRELNRQEEL